MPTKHFMDKSALLSQPVVSYGTEHWETGVENVGLHLGGEGNLWSLGFV
jgi:hypothetical protein